MSIEVIYSDSLDDVPAELKKLKMVTDNLDVFINAVDAVYIRSFPTKHYEQIKKVLNAGKHVLCESPITLDKQECKELFELAQAKRLYFDGGNKKLRIIRLFHDLYCWLKVEKLEILYQLMLPVQA